MVGKVYDAEATVKGAKVVNSTKDIITFTDDDGNFEILANSNDSISFSSLFHKTLTIKVRPSDLQDIIVVELKKVVNELNEVTVTKTQEKPFDSTQVKNLMKIQIENDFKTNPHNYQSLGNGSMDFIAIGRLIFSLFKNKKTNQTSIYVQFEHLETLFKNDYFFNQELLLNELHLKKEHQALFFEYCEAEQIDVSLLEKENHLVLLERLFQLSKSFNAALRLQENQNSKN
ncbi:carboxypeptidase-like regulatory domain-containing protein [Geojedonia litorea]|uniref:Carboxypeptidase-like regulatory domain-containing protein n=1 Tax=Geojedonia litorea TaxID=1268269 RepID=A0ABV9N3R4_9FLAO